MIDFVEGVCDHEIVGFFSFSVYIPSGCCFRLGAVCELFVRGLVVNLAPKCMNLAALSSLYSKDTTERMSLDNIELAKSLAEPPDDAHGAKQSSKSSKGVWHKSVYSSTYWEKITASALTMLFTIFQ